MPEYRFRLRISSERYLAYYEGVVTAVMVTLDDGRRVQFPASSLRDFLTHTGINGEFLVRTDDGNKLLEIVKLRD